MNSSVSHCFLPFGLKAIYVLYNEIYAAILLKKRLQWFWWKSSESE